MTKIKKISKQTLKKSYWNWAFFHLSSMNFAKFQTYGFLHSMMPVIKELYGDDKEEEIAAFKRHSVVFNVEPVMGAIIPGIVAGLEESKANGSAITDDSINEVKVGLMGPLAGIGDALIQGLFVPVALGLGITLAANGSILGPLFFLVASILMNVVFSRYIYFKGYSLGVKAIDLFTGDQSKLIQNSLKILGLISLGAIGAAYVNLGIKLEIGTVVFQELLDSIFPSLLPLLLLGMTYILRTKRQIKPISLIVVLMIISIIGVLLGIF